MSSAGDDRAPIGVVVIGGYLGAGKTTLVNHLLREGTGRSTMVLVNDFGAVSIDESLIEQRDGGLVSLANGCVCCGLSSPLMDTLLAIRAMPEPPELVVVETSGVADPAAVSHHALMPGFRLDGVVVVADAETVRLRAANQLVGATVLRQLRSADLLLLNKVDLADQSSLAGLRSWLAEQAPAAVVIDSVQSNVPVPLVVGLARDAHEMVPAHPPHHEAAHDAADHDTFAWQHDAPLDRAALATFLDDLPDGVVRAKGVLHVADDPDHAVVLQMVGRRWTLQRTHRWASVPRSVLVLVGFAGAVDGALLGTALHRTVA